MSEQKKSVFLKDYFRYFPVSMILAVVACAALAM